MSSLPLIPVFIHGLILGHVTLDELLLTELRYSGVKRVTLVPVDPFPSCSCVPTCQTPAYILLKAFFTKGAAVGPKI